MIKNVQIPPCEGKRLLLVRHAKAVHAFEADCADVDRPLSEKGKKDAAALAGILKDSGVECDFVCSSPAKRAFATAKAFADALGVRSITVDPRIYEASPETLFHLLRSLQDKRRVAMLVGHNPAFTEFAAALAPEIDDELPTCAVACIDFSTLSWDNVKPGSGKLAFLLSSKSL